MLQKFIEQITNNHQKQSIQLWKHKSSWDSKMSNMFLVCKEYIYFM